jgi:hypothetical protein
LEDSDPAQAGLQIEQGIPGSGEAASDRDTQPQADSQAVVEMRSELEQLKQMVAELTLKNRVLKKACRARRCGGTNDSAKPGRKT